MVIATVAINITYIIALFFNYMELNHFINYNLLTAYFKNYNFISNIFFF